MSNSPHPDGRHASAVLAGLVERVTFHNPENGFCVLRMKARGHRDLVTTVGHAAMISAGEWITASGTWLNDRNHGLQIANERAIKWGGAQVIATESAKLVFTPGASDSAFRSRRFR